MPPSGSRGLWCLAGVLEVSGSEPETNASHIPGEVGQGSRHRRVRDFATTRAAGLRG